MVLHEQQLSLMKDRRCTLETHMAGTSCKLKAAITAHPTGPERIPEP